MPTTTASFVAADWLAEHINDPEAQILDARMASPRQGDRDAGEKYREGHISGAAFFDIETLSDHTSSLPHMMSRPEAFAVAMRELDADQDKHLVIYDDGNPFSAPHAWWMLWIFGAENISILAGGLVGQKRDELMLREGDEDLPEDEFNVAFTPDAVVRVTDVLLASHEEMVQIVDARPVARFSGEIDEPRPGLKRGHVPSALNVPRTELVHDGELKTTDELDAILLSHGVNSDRPTIASCGLGVTVAVVVLALATLGVPDVALYDGAWNEWEVRNDLPVEPQL